MFPSLRSFASLPISQPFKKAALGLFHGKTMRTGNSVPFSLHKTRRTWHPNSHNKALYSEILGRWIKTTVTARALKCIDKMGGVDNYLLNTRTDLLGWEGMRLRVMVRDARRKLIEKGERVPMSAVTTSQAKGDEQSSPTATIS